MQKAGIKHIWLRLSDDGAINPQHSKYEMINIYKENSFMFMKENLLKHMFIIYRTNRLRQEC